MKKSVFLSLYFFGVLISGMIGFVSFAIFYLVMDYFFPDLMSFWIVPIISVIYVILLSLLLLTENRKKAYQIVWIIPKIIFSMGRGFGI